LIQKILIAFILTQYFKQTSEKWKKINRDPVIRMKVQFARQLGSSDGWPTDQCCQDTTILHAHITGISKLFYSEL
jgi:hypothetical protein